MNKNTMTRKTDKGMPVVDRLMKWSAVDSRTGCRVWNRHFSEDGYGLLHALGSTRRAHRLAWVVANGEIPPGMCVLHRCDNRACIAAGPPFSTEGHLFLGTNADNMADRNRKGRHYHGERHWNLVLTDEQVLQIRYCPWRRGLARILAEAYGVAENTIRAAHHYGYRNSALKNHPRM